MTEHHNEKASAWLDGQALSDQDLAALLREPEQRQQAGRYQLIGAVLRQEARPGMAADISAQVARQVAAEPALPKVRLPWWQAAANHRWLKPVANVAVAASVAVVAIVGVNNLSLPGAPGADSPAANGQSSSGPVLETAPMGGVVNPMSFSAGPMGNEAEAEQAGGSVERRQLQSFMLDHHQQLQLQQQQRVSDQEQPETLTDEPLQQPQ